MKRVQIVILAFIIIFMSSCSSAIYRKGVEHDEYPEKKSPIYDDAIVYEYDEGKDDVEISFGSKDDVDDIIDLQLGENGFASGDGNIPGFAFDSNSEKKPSLSPRTLPVFDDFSPVKGTVGTRISISGQHFESLTEVTILLGDIVLPIYSITEDQIDVVIPKDASSGKLAVVNSNQTFEVGRFTVDEQKKKQILKQNISISDSNQTIVSKAVSVVIPGGTLDHSSSILIESIANPQLANMPGNINGEAYAIEIDGQDRFDKPFTIEFDYNGKPSETPSVCYFNEMASVWNFIPCKITDENKIQIKTDHLTDFWVMYWGSSVYSKNGNFKMYFNASDKHENWVTMDDLVDEIGDSLEYAKAQFDAMLPGELCADFTYLGFEDAMDVYIESTIGTSRYNPLTNNILLAITELKTKEDVDITTAHELFHAYQDEVWNELPYGSLGFSGNAWAVEAIAELAAYEVYQDEFGPRGIESMVTPDNPYYLANGFHEYNMSGFIRYLINKSNTSFADMWVNIAKSDKTFIREKLTEYFEPKIEGFGTLGCQYIEFWKAVLVDSNLPHYEMIHQIIDEFTFSIDNHSEVFGYNATHAGTMGFFAFTAEGFFENMPKRIFNLKYIEDESGGVWSTKLQGLKSIEGIMNSREPGGYLWDYSFNPPIEGRNTYKLYEFEQDKGGIVMIAMEQVRENGTTMVEVSEIQAQCKPESIEDAEIGEEYKFEFAFNDVFEHVKNARAVIDFGDGEIETYDIIRKGKNISGKLTHVFNSLSNTEVKCSLYDTTNGKKELISRLVITVSINSELFLTVSPLIASVEEPIDFEVNLKNHNYTYVWNMDDGSKSHSEKGLTEVSYSYDEPGAYYVSVEVMDERWETIGIARETITVEVPEQPEQTETPESKPDCDTVGPNSLVVGRWGLVNRPYNSSLVEAYYTFNPDGSYVFEGDLFIYDDPFTSEDEASGSGWFTINDEYYLCKEGEVYRIIFENAPSSLILIDSSTIQSDGYTEDNRFTIGEKYIRMD